MSQPELHYRMLAINNHQSHTSHKQTLNNATWFGEPWPFGLASSEYTTSVAIGVSLIYHDIMASNNVG